jgi:uncharacterized membrane protein
MNNVNDHQHAVEVKVPVSVAYAQWSRFEELPRFMDGVESITTLPDGGHHWVVQIAGVEREFDTRISEQEQDQRIAWTTTSGAHHSGVVTFHRIDDNTSRVTLQMDFEPEGFLENVADKIGFVSGRIRGDMENFKDFIENRSQSADAARGTGSVG